MDPRTEWRSRRPMSHSHHARAGWSPHRTPQSHTTVIQHMKALGGFIAEDVWTLHAEMDERSSCRVGMNLQCVTCFRFYSIGLPNGPASRFPIGDRGLWHMH